ncbi:hypothetical protein ScalyP_jg1235 [Parmales sp. scaly parma]|nr:hypothetical protein ScalyP_jg1235 [Parmales sp. scaly parma]|tara:strand:+ start:364 stop:714 length:351 start_codon:yes stop_codon:yes gene_type:complete
MAPKITKAQKTKFVIDCKVPIDDKIIDPANFHKFLEDGIKHDGKKNNLASGGITITRDKTKMTVTGDENFSKRYLKYLTKKYLKKQQLKDYLRVVSVSKSTYMMKYYKVAETEKEE